MRIALVAYVFEPAELTGVRRAVGLRNGLESLGVETTVLTSTISGRRPDDAIRRVIRSGDVRRLLDADRVVPTARGEGQPERDLERRWWARAVVPDGAAVTWLPSALAGAAKLARDDPPDGVFTTSPPESIHLVGLYLRRQGIPWIADLRDGWTIDPPTTRSWFPPLDRALERFVLDRADVVTAVTKPLADALRSRFGCDAVHLPNGVDRLAQAQATDERAVLDPDRFSLVYTGTVGSSGRDLGPFMAALGDVLEERPDVGRRLEVVLAGGLTESELTALRAGGPAGVVRFLGRLPHRRALGLQRSADGLLLMTNGQPHVATGKVYEYLAAQKPIIGFVGRDAAADLLREAGGHTLAPLGDRRAMRSALGSYLECHLNGSSPGRASSSFRLEDYTYDTLAGQLLEMFGRLAASR
jgi:glycosyltransferase involved in cell wall biosynthesis